MSGRKTLNEKRLTKKQVQELIDAGAILRQDLADRIPHSPRVYELPGDRFLYVFSDWDSPQMNGRGDIYPGVDFNRFVRWCEKIEVDAAHGRNSSVGHWHYYSRHKSRLVDLVEPLIADLAATLQLDRSVLDRCYASLDAVSERVEAIGVERAQETLYDSLVAYVGEVLRQRDGGVWKVDTRSDQPYPYIGSKTRGVLMPINVVFDQLQGLEPADLRTATANEIRRGTSGPLRGRGRQ